jgi:biopolymer transport protein ExbD
MAHPAETIEPAPMIEMNTTPLIDVMLVLLIMLIITIPTQTHAVKLDLPTGPPPLRVDPVKNEIVIRRSDAILWNGRAVDEPTLRSELRFTRRMRIPPELHLRPDPDARYETVDRVLGLIKLEQVQKVGFVGNEAYAIR